MGVRVDGTLVGNEVTKYFELELVGQLKEARERADSSDKRLRRRILSRT